MFFPKFWHYKLEADPEAKPTPRRLGTWESFPILPLFFEISNVSGEETTKDPLEIVSGSR